MKNYLQLLEKVLNEGSNRLDRTGVGTRSIFAYQMRFNLKAGFPLVTTKKCHFHSIVHELLWFLSGQTNIRYLQENNVSIWNAWADDQGNLGPVYGQQWRAWKSAEGEIDQISHLLERLRLDPNSRRHIVSAWNVGELSKMALPPCHLLFQFYVNDRTLSCQLYQRSCDLFLGVPFNIASYSLLVHMIAQQLDYAVGEFIWTGGDIHIYHNHLEQVKIQLQRTPRPLPHLKLDKAASIHDYQAKDIHLLDYDPYPGIRAPIAV